MNEDIFGRLEDNERMRRLLEEPFGGLFGSISQQKVLEEIVADPYSEYSPKDLEELTGLSEPTVRDALSCLVDNGIVKKVSRRTKHPIYRPNLASKRLTALTLLAYGILDEMRRTNSMNDAIAYYCDIMQLSRKEFELIDQSTSSLGPWDWTNIPSYVSSNDSGLIVRRA
jgi:DNA-binding transcriptional ArsR family regulator